MRSGRFRTVVLATAVALVGQLGLGAGPALAAACQTSAGPSASYTVTVCLTSPADAVTLTGTHEVTATVSVNPVGAVDVDRVVFTWDDNNNDIVYLLADHDPDYRMTFRSSRLLDSTGLLEAGAVMADGTTATAGVTVTMSNDPTPPGTGQFTPRLGTAPGPGERFRIAAVGDGVDGSPASAAVADLIGSWDPDIFAYLGDVYDRGSAYEFDTWYGDPSGYGRFRDITNPAVGNHEYRTTDPVGAAPYFEFWENVPHYYSYDVGGWHVVVLDSTVEFNQLAPGSPQYEWLATDLAANQGRCTLTYLHHPRYTSVAGVGRDGLSEVWSLLVDRGVTLLLAGHAHTYERWTPMNNSGVPDPGGLTQIIAGTGGREIQNPKVPDSRVLADFTLPGALRLDLGSQDAAFAFVGADGVVRDSGTVPCRKPPAPPDTIAPTTPDGATVFAASPTSATISWRPSTDDVGVDGYTVRRGGVEIATLGASGTTYRDAKLAPGHRYPWTVEAFDASGNRSRPSPTITATTPFPQRSSRALLRQLLRAPEHHPGYTSARFPGWTDADGDRCVTTAEVLVQEAVRPPAVGARCVLTGGRWFSPYDGVTRTRVSRIVVDHLVPLSEAWQSSAYRWAKATRRQHANDLGYPSTLVAVSRTAATAKGGQEPQRWMPRKAYRCSYAAQWVAVKWRWRLAVDPAERRFLVRTLRACHWPTVRAPSRGRFVR